jgi:hypothetical protein
LIVRTAEWKMIRMTTRVLIATLAASLLAQVRGRLPRFDDYPVKGLWQPGVPGLNLATPSERMFRTNLTNAAKEPPNFARRLPSATCRPRRAGWQRWIECTACFDGAETEFHPDSRLMIVRCGLNFSERLQRNIPDTYYSLWEGDRFHKLLFVSGKAAANDRRRASSETVRKPISFG